MLIKKVYPAKKKETGWPGSKMSERIPQSKVPLISNGVELVIAT